MESGWVSAKRVVTALPSPAEPLHRSIAGLARRAVADGQPVTRNFELECPAGLQIRLIEHRDGQVGPRRHEQRVEEVGIAVERGVAGRELDLHLGDARRQGRRRQHDVVLRKCRRHCRAVDGHACDVGRARGEVEYQRLGGVAQGEPRRHHPGDRRLLVPRDVQRQLVAQVGDDRGSSGRDLERDAGRRRAGLRRGRPRSRQESQRRRHQSDVRHPQIVIGVCHRYNRVAPQDRRTSTRTGDASDGHRDRPGDN